MENPNKVKRSIRIPKEIHDRLKEIAREKQKSVNKIIIEILKEKV